MNVKKICNKVWKKYGVKVQVSQDERSTFLRGNCRDWQTVVKIGKMFVDKSGRRHVVNDIVPPDFTKECYLPDITDKKIDGTSWDVVIVGGGISGCCVARELSRYNLRILLCEKHSDVAHGASGANDGMVHAGIDLKKPCKKLHYVVKGNAMYGDLCRDLGVDFVREGQYVVFASKLIKLLARSYLHRAKKHNIANVSIIGRKEICSIEPTVSDFAVGALKIETTGAVSPYKLTIACAENACRNGVVFSFDTAVLDMDVQRGKIVSVTTNRGTVSA